MLDYVCIFASGSGTRLQPLTKYIPKVLVNMSNNNLLVNIINYWKRYTNNFIIIINTKYYEMVDEYLKLHDINYIIRIVDIDKQENSFTIRHALDSSFYNKKLLFTWCDIYPDEIIPNNIFNDKNIIFTYGNECRYIVNNNSIEKNKNGNVIGIFYFSNYQGLKECNDYYDLCDVYCDNYNSFESYNLNKLIDIGDMGKLDNYLLNCNTKYITRFFNDIIDYNEYLLKKSNCIQGDDIIKNEINWYKNINKSYLPKIINYDKNSFIIEKINGISLYKKFWNYEYSDQEKVLIKVLDRLKDLHSTKKEFKNDIILKDTMKEIYSKIIERLNKVKNIIDSFGTINNVNGVQINNNFIEVIDNIFKNINKYLYDRDYYSTIHGDCQFSNIIVDMTESIFFIDPRGYYGDTILYGLEEYDYGKVSYALSGYDTFNNNNKYFINMIVNDSITINITDNLYKFEDIIKNYTDINITKQLVVINWLGLAQYNQNNILKCISSYYYGLYLYTSYKL